MFRKLLWFAPAAGILLLASTGNAAVKVTPALQKPAAGTFICRLLNAGPKQLIDVEMKIINAVNGAVLSEASTADPEPGTSTSIVYNGTSTIAYCTVKGSFPRKRGLVTLCATVDGICQTTAGDPGL